MVNRYYAKISGTGHYVPEKVLNNFDLEKIVDTNDEWIRTRTGMFERRVAAPDQAASDLAYEASLKALESANLRTKDIDLIIVGTISGDHAFPSTACLVSKKLGIKMFLLLMFLPVAPDGFMLLMLHNNLLKTELLKMFWLLAWKCLQK